MLYLKNLESTSFLNSFSVIDFLSMFSHQSNLRDTFVLRYWLGSQAVGQPLYQYRLILVDDDKMLNVASDMDCSLEIELKAPVTENIQFKTTSAVRAIASQVSLNYSH